MLPALRQNRASPRFYREPYILILLQRRTPIDLTVGTQNVPVRDDRTLRRRSSTDDSENKVEGRCAGGLIFLLSDRRHDASSGDGEVRAGDVVG